MAVQLSRRELNEEIEHFRDYCGWPEKRVEDYLGLAEGTLAQRRHRATRKERDTDQAEAA